MSSNIFRNLAGSIENRLIDFYFDILAHNEAIWCCAWRKRESDGKDIIVTGALDNSLKLWEW